MIMLLRRFRSVTTAALLFASAPVAVQGQTFLKETSGNGNLQFNEMPTAEEKAANPEFGFPWCFLDSTEAPIGSKAGPPLRVLFLGNSLTYYNEMPRMFSALAASGLRRRVVVGLASLPGVPLAMLWNTDAPSVIDAYPWDVVVVQLQPSSPSDPGLGALAVSVSAAITAKRAQAIGWGQPGSPLSQRAFDLQIDGIVAGAAFDAGMTLAPISGAWAAVRRADTTVWKDLFYNVTEGGSNDHPSRMGSYLMALMFYQSISGQSPVGLPATTGTAKLSVDMAARLQQIAAGVKYRPLPTVPGAATKDSAEALKSDSSKKKIEKKTESTTE